MPDASIVVAQPATATQLVLLFHGVGSSATDLVPIAESVARARAGAAVVSVDAPHASTLGSGREWFSVVGVTEHNRPQRIAEAMPLFTECVTRWQAATGIAPAATALVGFSQGAIMALESTQLDRSPLAGCVIALAGRFAGTVRRPPAGVRFHLVHGEADQVVPTRLSIDAARALKALGADVSLALVPGLGHGIDGRALRLVLAALDNPRA